MPLGDRLTSTFLGAELGKSNLVGGMDLGPDFLTGIQKVGRLVEKSGNSVSGKAGRGDWNRPNDIPPDNPNSEWTPDRVEILGIQTFVERLRAGDAA